MAARFSSLSQQRTAIVRCGSDLTRRGGGLKSGAVKIAAIIRITLGVGVVLSSTVHVMKKHAGMAQRRFLEGCAWKAQLLIAATKMACRLTPGLQHIEVDIENFPPCLIPGPGRAPAP